MEALKQKFPDYALGSDAAHNHVLTVPLADYVNVITVARDELGYRYLSCLSGKDTKEELVLAVHLFQMDLSEPQPGLVVQVGGLPREGAEVPSITSLFPTADWHERETYDMFGIRFAGHPNPRRILLPDNWQGGHPLLKDFVDKRPKRPRLVRERGEA